MKLLAVISFMIAVSLNSLCAGQQASSARTSAKVGRSEYVGLRIAESLPAGLKSGNHFLVASKSGVDIPLDFGIREVSKGKIRMLWLERVAERNAKSVLRWEVLDVLVLPPVKKNQVLAASYCFIGKEYEPEVFAIFNYQDKQYFTRARRAWRANRFEERFEEIPTKNIRCENEGWGV
jgi:hypothetical protein